MKYNFLCKEKIRKDRYYPINNFTFTNNECKEETTSTWLISVMQFGLKANKIIKYNKDGSILSEEYITMLNENIDAGYKNTDDYYNKIIKLFMDWNTHTEVVNGRWPKTIEECFCLPKKCEYPLIKEDAIKLADHFIDVYAPSRSEKNKLREFEGFVVDGPEYLSIFNGFTGDEMQTIKYKPGRDDDGLMWGDYSAPRIEPANRVDRFLAGVAYLDGEKPYAIFARGYYTRSAIASYSWDDKEIKEYWFIDSGLVPIFSAEGTLANNDTKGNPCLIADIFGDWREELLLRKGDNSDIRIYFNTEITNKKLYTLMHDRKYRVDIARQNNGYNQPAYTSFYFASDIDWSKVPIFKL